MALNHVDPEDDRYGLMLRHVLDARERQRRESLKADAQADQRQKGFGYLIERMRTAACMSQGDLAGRLGTSQSSVSRWESGRHTPSLHTLNLIAGATGFDLLIGARGRGDEIDVFPPKANDGGPMRRATRTIDARLLILGYVVDEEPLAELWLVANGTV